MTTVRKNSIFIYGASNKKDSLSKNPYLHDLTSSLTKHFKLYEFRTKRGYGVLELLFVIFKVDIVYLNWTENMPDRKYGLIQTLLYFLILPLLRLNKVCIIYTVHNRISHSSHFLLLKQRLMHYSVGFSNLTITHSKEGQEFIQSHFSKISDKTLFLPHPTKLRIKNAQKQSGSRYDILIWGTIYPYKGILEFLEDLMNHDLLNNYKIRIAGLCEDDAYASKLLKFVGSSVTFLNRFVDPSELEELFSTSRIVLFTYNTRSVFSSGSVIETLRFHSRIIGPKVGEFIDLEESSLILTYNAYDDLISKIDYYINEQEKLNLERVKRIEDYLDRNSWGKFAEKVSSYMFK